jgi:hypothetical protein
MAYGDITLFTVGYTATDSGSKRKNYPIKRKYKQTDRGRVPSFPSSYELYGTDSYWFPYQEIEPSDDNHVVYTAGDEYAWDDTLERRPPALQFADPNIRKYEDYPAFHRVVYANEIYVSTNYYFNWSDTKFAQNNNPYPSNRVRKWKKLNDQRTVWVQYWYHPLLRRFYVLADIDTIQELPNFDEVDQTRWGAFKGDSTDLNIDSFTLAQIRELVSTGYTVDAATAVVAAAETTAAARRVTADQAVQTKIDTSMAESVAYRLQPRTVTLSVARAAASTDNDIRETVASLPQMYQRKYNKDTGNKDLVDRFYFRIRPNKINYSEIGANWVPIERVNNFPLIDYKNPKLMKISFEFVVEKQTSGISSVYESCEEELLLLRRMATNAERVSFTNFDSLFAEAIATTQYPSTAHEFAIVDMTVSSVVRTQEGNSTTQVSVQGQISRATVNMTIQEVRVTPTELIFMPKIGKDKVITTGGGGGGGGGDKGTCKLDATAGEFMAYEVDECVPGS